MGKTDIFERFGAGDFLATVVAVTGSGYRRAGARMVFRADGVKHGSVSGGCLERDLVRHGPGLLAKGPTTVLYDTRSEEFLDAGRFGTGCEGVVAIMLQRYGDVEFAGVLGDDFESAVLAQIWEGPEESIGAAMLWRDGAEVEFGLEGFEGLRTCVEVVARDKESMNLDVEDRGWKILVEHLEPRLDLLIVGVGQDARILCALSKLMGFGVRIAWHDPIRLAEFSDVRCEQIIENSLAKTQVTANTAVVLMTHDLKLDASLARSALESQAWYVGLMGPKMRTAKIVGTWKESGWMPNKELDRLHTPVGLDLGGDSPDEVALSILAEIVALKNKRSGGQLKDRTRSIHEPIRHLTTRFR